MIDAFTASYLGDPDKANALQSHFPHQQGPLHSLRQVERGRACRVILEGPGAQCESVQRGQRGRRVERHERGGLLAEGRGESVQSVSQSRVRYAMLVRRALQLLTAMLNHSPQPTPLLSASCFTLPNVSTSRVRGGAGSGEADRPAGRTAFAAPVIEGLAGYRGEARRDLRAGGRDLPLDMAGVAGVLEDGM